ncbi:hypothetical protein Arub01_08910 [Actinomadura rubrobrunea]|uniref:Uncharacterized protein n=1 Tax=Actinomadura rubrobrunea TaxID=115335 RepID=A0A9W6PSG5_9ACTN|nr:hypothetical protein [Actinomadura rubrobrunea]GLW62647.1 hypothetical protein Arub01_08910 [Actinomadura rubrobrunea]
MGRNGEVTFDPGALTAAQRDGDACVLCHKKWPRPRIRVGRLPEGQGVFACEECAPAIRPVPRPRREQEEPDTNVGAPVGRPEPARTAVAT